MNLSDFITVYNATTNVEKHNRPEVDNLLSLGNKIVNGDVVCKAYKNYERNYTTCNIYKFDNVVFHEITSTKN
jgi:hypothetical protein